MKSGDSGVSQSLFIELAPGTSTLMVVRIRDVFVTNSDIMSSLQINRSLALTGLALLRIGVSVQDTLDRLSRSFTSSCDSCFSLVFPTNY